MADTLTQDQALDAIAGWTVLELSEFVKAFEDKFGVTAAAPVAVAAPGAGGGAAADGAGADRKSTRLNSSHANISYAVFCLKKKKNKEQLATRRHVNVTR